jgi:hypothetical protein
LAASISSLEEQVSRFLPLKETATRDQAKNNSLNSQGNGYSNSTDMCVCKKQVASDLWQAGTNSVSAVEQGAIPLGLSRGGRGAIAKPNFRRGRLPAGYLNYVTAWSERHNILKQGYMWGVFPWRTLQVTVYVWTDNIGNKNYTKEQAFCSVKFRTKIASNLKIYFIQRIVSRDSEHWFFPSNITPRPLIPTLKYFCKYICHSDRQKTMVSHDLAV